MIHIKRLHGTDGQARLLLSELIASLSTRTKQDGNALQNILEKLHVGNSIRALDVARELHLL